MNFFISDKSVLGARKHQGRYISPLINCFIDDYNQKGGHKPRLPIHTELIQYGKYSDILYDYQKQLIAWTWHNPNKGKLWQVDMRVGKTLAALSYADLKKYKNVLFVTLKTVVRTIQRECERFIDREMQEVTARSDYPSEQGWFVTNHEMFLAEQKRAIKQKRDSWFHQEWDLIIIDECHKFKSRKSKNAMEAVTISDFASDIILMTGTTQTKYYDDLYMLFRIGNKKAFQSYWKFVDTFCYSEQLPYGARPRVVTANRDFNPQETWNDIMYFLTKQEAWGYVPEKEHQNFYCRLEGQQQHAYSTALEEFWIELGIEHDDAELLISGILPLLIRLRQIVNAPIVFNESNNNVKVNLLRELLENNEIQSPAIIWHHFIRTGEEIERALEGYSFTRVTAQHSQDQRQELVDQFQNEEIDFIISPISVLGTGLSLSRAETMIYFEKDFNYANYIQSLDRPVYKNRKTNIQVMHLIVENTVDMLIEQRLTEKIHASQRMYRHELAQLIGE